MKRKVFFGIFIILQAVLVLSIVCSSYLQYGGMIAVSANMDIAELSGILESKGIPHKVVENGSNPIIQTTAKLSHLLAFECSQYGQVEPIYQRYHRSFFLAICAETVILTAYLFFCGITSSKRWVRYSLWALCYAVIIAALHLLRNYSC